MNAQTQSQITKDQLFAWLADKSNMKAAIDYAITESRKVDLSNALLSDETKKLFINSHIQSYAIEQIQQPKKIYPHQYAQNSLCMNCKGCNRVHEPPKCSSSGLTCQWYKPLTVRG